MHALTCPKVFSLGIVFKITCGYYSSLCNDILNAVLAEHILNQICSVLVLSGYY